MFEHKFLNEEKKLVLFKFSEIVTDDEFNNFVTTIDEYCCDTFYAIFDIDSIKGTKRTDILEKAKFLFSKEEEFKKKILGLVVITKSYLLKKAIKFLFYLRKFNKNILITENLEIGENFLYDIIYNEQ
tara:strand:+ start:282 stop:665 length:384 start_codon:yes stop_codon:yes gene_type:complete